MNQDMPLLEQHSRLMSSVLVEILLKMKDMQETNELSDINAYTQHIDFYIYTKQAVSRQNVSYITFVLKIESLLSKVYLFIPTPSSKRHILMQTPNPIHMSCCVH